MSDDEGSTTSVQSKTGWTQKLMDQWGKLNIADHARKMRDNERVLNTVAKDDREWRKMQREFAASQGGTSMPDASDKVDEMGDINIDSPTTHNHYSAERSSGDDRQPSLLRRALPYVAAAGLGAAGFGLAAPLAMSLLRPDEPAPQVQPAEPQPPVQPETEIRERTYDYEIGDPIIE